MISCPTMETKSFGLRKSLKNPEMLEEKVPIVVVGPTHKSMKKELADLSGLQCNGHTFNHDPTEHDQLID